MSCVFCDSTENLSKCPRCGREVCLDDLALPHHTQLSFNWNGKPPSYLVCIACRITTDYEAGLLEERDPEPDDNGERQCGVIYRPTPLALDRFSELTNRCDSLSVLELKLISERLEESMKLAEHLALFLRTKKFIVESTLAQRINTIRKRKAYKRQEVKASAPVRKSQPKDKLVELAIKLAKTGLSSTEVLELLKRARA